MAGSRIEHRGQSSQETGLSFFPPAPPRQGSKLRRGQGVAALGGPLTAANGQGERAWSRRVQPQRFLAAVELFPLGASAAWERVVPTEKPTRLWAGRDTSLPVRIDLTVRAAIARSFQEPKPMRRTSFPRARFSGTTSVKASSAFSASFRLRPERAAIWWTSSPLPTMFSVAICLCSSFVFMGRTKHVPCPSAVLLAVVPTKPCYTIVPVFVKGRCLLLDMSRLGMLVLVVLGGICSLPDARHRFHCPRRELCWLLNLGHPL